MSRNFNYDRFVNVNPRLSAQAAIAVLTGLQDFPPEAQMAGLAVAFANLTDLFGLHEGTAIQVARNLMARERHAVPELRAVRAYTENEL